MFINVEVFPKVACSQCRSLSSKSVSESISVEYSRQSQSKSVREESHETREYHERLKDVF